jgi:hypothetical protein
MVLQLAAINYIRCVPLYLRWLPNGWWWYIRYVGFAQYCWCDPQCPLLPEWMIGLPKSSAWNTNKSFSLFSNVFSVVNTIVSPLFRVTERFFNILIISGTFYEFWNGFIRNKVTMFLFSSGDINIFFPALNSLKIQLPFYLITELDL